MKKIITLNLNGIRSAFRKDFSKYIDEQNADILCFQEVKLPIDIIPDGIAKEGYTMYTSFSNKNGYSGVMCLTKQQPINVISRIGFEKFDDEGRILILEFTDYVIVNIYIPHGGRQKEKLEYKLEVYKYLLDYLKSISNKNIILIGDFNIAHTEKDVENSKTNINNIMFTPEERKQIDSILELGYVDSFRINNKEKGSYTWFPYSFEAKNRNLGWRIDYIFVTRNIEEKVKEVTIDKSANFSDHCPVIMKIDI